MSEPDLRDPRLDRAYRELPGEEPSAQADERIRAAARRAVGARPQSLEGRRRSWVSRWSVPVSLAASVVIVATLTLMIQDEYPPREYRPRDDVAPAVAPAAVEPVAPPSTATERAAPPAPEAARRKDSAPASARKPAAPAAAPELRSAPATDAMTPAPPRPEELEKQLEELKRRQQLRDESQAKPRAAVPAPPPAVPDPLSRERAAGERPERALRSAPAAARAEQARSPEVWLEDIRRLKAEGRDADAAAELAEFRRRYPDYTLPADLAR